ncbi:CDF family Co(II)/Ni(II) efflux transporter DmeF [Acidiphilium sp. AL]|uniref:CDF family Co(II)/Ni(II) efflux transporter DmeF n=1 Tax=Acidiphilium iwatense TaxID=768198 RepID=A0ABS9DRA9_9PROT|nr:MULTISPECIES: CDF family Co(II)/Ni(II) efflux transporter DmeF [Acidiphilium]MCF3945189.1 CDF family Co(II)/Ni(II) efflux transporter DmeF [Acidiphilium iwatense]MCU4160138.1 CDF family Co(II)/Ni(II) efflux transporter DmeF [Acidiphilium sp. AL]
MTNGHRHIFLGESNARNERRTWFVVALTTAMMLVEIVGGTLFHSIALVADGIHMSTHAGVMLLAALAYRYARRHAEDSRFALGTGKFGDLAAFASAIVLAMFALLIGYAAISRFFAPEHIDYAAAIPIAVIGLAVNAASALLLAGDHDHGHDHHHGHDHGHDHHHDDAHPVQSRFGLFALEVFEDGVPPRFRLTGPAEGLAATIETVRPDGTRQSFAMVARSGFLESRDEIPEPHQFQAVVRLDRGGTSETHDIAFAEHAHDDALHRDNNMRAAYVHVLADSAVSGLVIAGLLMAKFLGWVWMDPIMGLVGAGVVANWSYGLIRAAGAILLDMTPSPDIPARIRSALERDGNRITDLHVWRLGPGHLGAIIALQSPAPAPPERYKAQLAAIRELSHVTVEVEEVV